MGLIYAVLREFRKENPYITYINIKSENAGSYQRNFAAFKFSIKTVNPKAQSFCVMITMSLIYYQVPFYCFVAG